MNKDSNPLQDGGSGSGSNKRHLGTDIDEKASSSNRKKICPGTVREDAKEQSGPFTRNDMNTSMVDLLQGGNSKAPASAPAASAPSTGQAHGGMGPSVTEEVGVTFPERLMELVMNETDKEALWWLPGSNSTFAIHSKKFTKTILAKNFQGSKFESFTRKLARWGFKRLSGSDNPPPHTFHFQHPYFRRDRPELAKEISGSKKKIAAMVQEEKISRQQPTDSSSNLNKASAPGSPPAPWPTVTEQQQVRAMDDTCTISAGATAQCEADISSHQLQQQQVRAARAGSGESFSSAAGQLLSSDLELQLLLRSMTDSNQRVPQQQGAAAAAILAEQDRTRSLLTELLTGSPAARQQASLVDLSSASASLNLPSMPSRISSDRASAVSSLSDLLPGSFTGDSNNRALAAAVLRASSSSARPSIFQQQQQQQATHQASPAPTVTASDTNHLVRLYLQQQEQANRQEALRMQRNEALQEILRRQRQGPPF